MLRLLTGFVENFSQELDKFTLTTGKHFHNALISSVYGYKTNHPVMLFDEDCSDSIKQFVSDKNLIILETKPSPNGGGLTQPTQAPAQKQKVYTGSQVKQKLYGLGFKESKSGAMIYNTNVSNIYDVSHLYADFYIEGGEVDMRMGIMNSNPAFDQKLRMVFAYILPSSGGRLYSILDQPNVKSPTLTMDGRKICITIKSYGIDVTFGPIIK